MLNRLHSILTEVAEGRTSPEAALARLRDLPYEDLDFARLDHHRALRQGAPEVVFGQGKTPAQVVAIVARMVAQSGSALVTRADAEMAAQVLAAQPGATYHAVPRLITVGGFAPPSDDNYVAVLAAGTSDLPVAEEAAVTLEWLGVAVKRIWDVGAAGLHRLLDQREALWAAQAIVVVAGMEGALATVVGGLAGCPIVAVPTSVGYGASFNGLAPLLTMLNTCTPGVAVVNIDNGFGAAMFAHRIVVPAPKLTVD
jgi:NCAIR mutase (PurE)-related protein